MAGVNVLLMQQVQEVAADTPADCVQVTDWFGRLKYIQDSYAAEVTEKTDREQELDEVKAVPTLTLKYYHIKIVRYHNIIISQYYDITILENHK